MNSNSTMFQKVSDFFILAHSRAQRNERSVLGQTFDLIWLKLRRGMGPNYYHTVGLWRKTVSWSEKNDHISPGEYKKIVDILTPPKYQKLSQNKIVEKALLTIAGIPTAEYFGKLSRIDGTDKTGNPLTSIDELVRLITTHNVEKLVLKGPEGHTGLQTYVIQVKQSSGGKFEYRMLTDDVFSDIQNLSEVLRIDRDREWLVERYLDQHPSTSILNPTSLNSLRVWVLRDSAGKSRVLRSYLRIGVGSVFVDNNPDARIISKFNLKTGALSIAKKGDIQYTEYARHPTSGVQIEGYTLPFLEEIIELSKKAICAFPNTRFAGLDIALTTQGPVVIELNVQPSLSGSAIACGPTRSLFIQALKG